jgi:hypothetical protein
MHRETLVDAHLPKIHVFGYVSKRTTGLCIFATLYNESLPSLTEIFVFKHLLYFADGWLIILFSTTLYKLKTISGQVALPTTPSPAPPPFRGCRQGIVLR